MKPSIQLFNGLMISLLLSGCMGYQLGGTRGEGIETIYMAPLINQTTESAIELPITEALRHRLQFDGRLKLKNSGEAADAIMEVRLTNYTLTAIAFRDALKTTTQQYRFRITAVATLTDTETGTLLSKSKTYGETTFTLDADLLSSKRDAFPRAAQELAKFMIEDLIELW